MPRADPVDGRRPVLDHLDPLQRGEALDQVGARGFDLLLDDLALGCAATVGFRSEDGRGVEIGGQ